MIIAHQNLRRIHLQSTPKEVSRGLCKERVVTRKGLGGGLWLSTDGNAHFQEDDDRVMNETELTEDATGSSL
jgi:hypothetical protein